MLRGALRYGPKRSAASESISPNQGTLVNPPDRLPLGRGPGAVLAEAGITRFDCSLAEVRHREPPFTIRRAASDDKALVSGLAIRFSFHEL